MDGRCDDLRTLGMAEQVAGCSHHLERAGLRLLVLEGYVTPQEAASRRRLYIGLPLMLAAVMGALWVFIMWAGCQEVV